MRGRGGSKMVATNVKYPWSEGLGIGMLPVGGEGPEDTGGAPQLGRKEGRDCDLTHEELKGGGRSPTSIKKREGSKCRRQWKWVRAREAWRWRGGKTSSRWRQETEERGRRKLAWYFLSPIRSLGRLRRGKNRRVLRMKFPDTGTRYRYVYA